MWHSGSVIDRVRQVLSWLNKEHVMFLLSVTFGWEEEEEEDHTRAEGMTHGEMS